MKRWEFDDGEDDEEVEFEIEVDLRLSIVSEASAESSIDVWLLLLLAAVERLADVNELVSGRSLVNWRNELRFLIAHGDDESCRLFVVDFSVFDDGKPESKHEPDEFKFDLLNFSVKWPGLVHLRSFK